MPQSGSGTGQTVLYSQDADRGMTRYARKMARFTHLALPTIVDFTEDLRAGREVDFSGR